MKPIGMKETHSQKQFGRKVAVKGSTRSPLRLFVYFGALTPAPLQPSPSRWRSRKRFLCNWNTMSHESISRRIQSHSSRPQLGLNSNCSQLYSYKEIKALLGKRKKGGSSEKKKEEKVRIKGIKTEVLQPMSSFLGLIEKPASPSKPFFDELKGISTLSIPAYINSPIEDIAAESKRDEVIKATNHPKVESTPSAEKIVLKEVTPLPAKQLSAEVPRIEIEDEPTQSTNSSLSHAKISRNVTANCPIKCLNKLLPLPAASFGEWIPASTSAAPKGTANTMHLKKIEDLSSELDSLKSTVFADKVELLGQLSELKSSFTEAIEALQREVANLSPQVIAFQKYLESTRSNQFMAGGEFVMKHLIERGQISIETASDPCLQFFLPIFLSKASTGSRPA